MLQSSFLSAVVFIPHLVAMIVFSGSSLMITNRLVTKDLFHRNGRLLSSKKLLYSSSSSSSMSKSSMIQQGISRIETLQTILTKFGVPGATKCNQPNDLQPVHHDTADILTLQQLHPHLYPIARSTQHPDYFICALKRPGNNMNESFEKNSNYDHAQQVETPWPIVESKLNGPGYTLLSLHGEHLMRRIVAHADFLDIQTDVIDLYNHGLGQGKEGGLFSQRDQALDIPYERGSVKKLGYGLDKYTLLRIGPFPDLYQTLSRQHLFKEDESSALIAAESANSKFTGFASTFLYYSQLLSIMKQRQEETRDAARLCLRLPLSSIGMEEDHFLQTALLGQLIPKEMKQVDSNSDDIQVGGKETSHHLVFDILNQALERIRENEQEDERTRASMTPTQLAIEEANYLLDQTTLNTNRDWSSIRSKLGNIYASVGMTDMAAFVDIS